MSSMKFRNIAPPDVPDLELLIELFISSSMDKLYTRTFLVSKKYWHTDMINTTFRLKFATYFEYWHIFH